MKTDSSATLKLEGKISGPWVDELRRCWDSVATRERNAVAVDMRGVTFVDDGGGKLLRDMERQGALLVECSEFIRQLVNAADAGRQAARTNGKKTKKEN